MNDPRKRFSEEEQELVDLNQQLLDCIAAGEWETYLELCDHDLTCFEPEAAGIQISGMPFHKYYFDLASKSTTPVQTTMTQVNVRIVGHVAMLAYVRVIQKLKEGCPQTQSFEETRIWEKQEGEWKHIHFHRSLAGGWNS